MSKKSVTDGPSNPFALSGTSPPSDTKQIGIALMRRNIIQFLAGVTEHCTEKQLMKLVRGRKQHKVTALRDLVNEGRVIRHGAGKRH